MILIQKLLADDEEVIGIAETHNVVEQNEKSPVTWKDQVTGMLPLLCIFLVFYVFILRPQSKKLKARNKMINELKVGDRVKTSGGMIVTIKKIDSNDNLLTEIASGVEANFSKDSVIAKI